MTKVWKGRDIVRLEGKKRRRKNKDISGQANADAKNARRQSEVMRKMK